MSNVKPPNHPHNSPNQKAGKRKVGREDTLNVSVYSKGSLGSNHFCYFWEYLYKDFEILVNKKGWMTLWHYGDRVSFSSGNQRIRVCKCSVCLSVKSKGEQSRKAYWGVSKLLRPESSATISSRSLLYHWGGGWDGEKRRSPGNLTPNFCSKMLLVCGTYKSLGSKSFPYHSEWWKTAKCGRIPQVNRDSHTF